MVFNQLLHFRKFTLGQGHVDKMLGRFAPAGLTVQQNGETNARHSYKYHMLYINRHNSNGNMMGNPDGCEKVRTQRHTRWMVWSCCGGQPLISRDNFALNTFQFAESNPSLFAQNPTQQFSAYIFPGRATTYKLFPKPKRCSEHRRWEVPAVADRRNSLFTPFGWPWLFL